MEAMLSNKLWTKEYILALIISFMISISMNMLFSTIALYGRGLSGSDVYAGLLATVFTLAALASRGFMGMIFRHFSEGGAAFRRTDDLGGGDRLSVLAGADGAFILANGARSGLWHSVNSRGDGHQQLCAAHQNVGGRGLFGAEHGFGDGDWAEYGVVALSKRLAAVSKSFCR